MTATVRRYAFDTEFDATGAVVRQGARTRSYSIEEVEQERATAFAAGRNDEVARAQAQVAQAVSAIAQATQDLTRAVAAERRAMLADAAALALAAARKTAGAALDAYGIARVQAVLEDAFESLVGAPRVIVRLSPALEDARALLEETARANGFDGALLVRADPAIALGDVTLDWGEGAVVHDQAEALRRIEDAVTRGLAGMSETGSES